MLPGATEHALESGLMNGAVLASRSATPTIDIQHDPEVLDEIQCSVISACCAAPNGGVETGGVLMGQLGPDRILITGSVPFISEHAFGPGYVFSDRDRGHFGNLLAAAKLDPHQKPVGWYRSQIVGDLALTDADLEIHRRFFEEPRHVVLLLKPGLLNPTKCAYFIPNGGSHQTNVAAHEFELAPNPGKPAEETSPTILTEVTAGAPEPSRDRFIENPGDLPLSELRRQAAIPAKPRWISRVAGWVHAAAPEAEDAA